MLDRHDHYSALYSAYAAGVLDPAFALLIETQSVLREDIRLDVMLSETISGALLEREAEASLSSHALAKALAAIDALEEAIETPRGISGDVEASFAELQALPAPLKDPALVSAGARSWQQLVPGIHRLPLDVGSQLEVELYRIQPGARSPRHSHGGIEFSLVVSGGFTDETGSYGPGDLSVKGPEDTHRPQGDPGEPCFVLAVRDAGLRFTGLMGLIQRVIGR